MFRIHVDEPACFVIFISITTICDVTILSLKYLEKLLVRKFSGRNQEYHHRKLYIVIVTLKIIHCHCHLEKWAPSELMFLARQKVLVKKP